MTDGHPGIPLEHVVPVGQDELHFPIQHERLGAKLVADEELLDEVVIRMGILLHLLIGVGDILGAIDPGDPPGCQRSPHS